MQPPAPRDKPWGETRYTYGAMPTSYHFTRQREESAIGLYDHGACWYDPHIARFIQADTIVPQPEKPQGLKR